MLLSKVVNGTDIMRMIPAMEMIPRMIETIVKIRDPSLKRYTVIAASAPATNDMSKLNPCVARSTFSGTTPAISAPSPNNLSKVEKTRFFRPRSIKYAATTVKKPMERECHIPDDRGRLVYRAHTRRWANRVVTGCSQITQVVLSDAAAWIIGLRHKNQNDPLTSCNDAEKDSNVKWLFKRHTPRVNLALI